MIHDKCDGRYARGPCGSHLTAGTGPLAKTPLLTRGPVALLILRSAGDVPLHHGGGAPLGLRTDLRVNLPQTRIVNDDNAINGNNDAGHAEHKR